MQLQAFATEDHVDEALRLFKVLVANSWVRMLIIAKVSTLTAASNGTAGNDRYY